MANTQEDSVYVEAVLACSVCEHTQELTKELIKLCATQQSPKHCGETMYFGAKEQAVTP